MAPNWIASGPDWASPAFKVLANNDTAMAPGHQGGIVIPVELRRYFPALAGVPDATNPTVDVRVKADLYAEHQFLANVDTRYQYQTWGAERRPESRLTDQLGPLRALAKGGDILIIQQHTHDAHKYRLTLVRQATAEYEQISQLVGPRRWGAL